MQAGPTRHYTVLLRRFKTISVVDVFTPSQSGALRVQLASQPSSADACTIYLKFYANREWTTKMAYTNRKRSE